MKRSQSVSVFAFAASLIWILVVSPASNAVVQHEFRIEEYELFHDVLRPLQHEALPQSDFQRIRSMASELVARGKAIVKLGVPEAPRVPRREFAEARRKFDRALDAFWSDSKSGSNAKLKKSFTRVHDFFEELAALVPAVYPGGAPPVVNLNCPSSKLKAGTEITLTADTVQSGELVFLWTISNGKILAGQGTRTIIIDTTELAGQTISVEVEVNDGSGHVTVVKCEAQISSGQ